MNVLTTTPDIPYDSEAKLRGDGSSRTPDVLLSVPIAVRLSEDGTGSEEKWSIINWIDSKVHNIVLCGTCSLTENTGSLRRRKYSQYICASSS